MKSFRIYTKYCCASVVFILAAVSFSAHAADKALLDILLDNGAITQGQHKELMLKPSLSSKDFGVSNAATATEVEGIVERKVNEAIDQKLDKHIDAKMEKTITDQVAKKVEQESPVKVSHGKKGFRFESRDGNWQTNLGWRAQLRYTSPYRSDPRSLANFAADTQNTFEARRLRMKIGGHGYRPWLGYYFEVDLEPTRSTSDSSSSSSSRVIDWRITVDKYEWAALRLGQWKIDYNRERVDSSGRQQFVERSIVNRQFTIDRQVGVQLRGRLFKETPADLRYYVGAFTGEGRGVRNDDEDLMWAGRLQWNFLGRDLKTRQTDVEYTKLPTGSLSFGAATNTGRCTRWSSSGCGNLSGFASPATAANGQFEVEQYTQGFAFKWKGLSIQQEFHWKEVDDTVNNATSDMEGAYVQSGYFFHHLIPAIPKQLEFAARYAFVDEPNATNVLVNNRREEFTLGANWFFAGHNSKITADFSYLSLEDVVVNREVNDNRFRVQYDVSF
jgi:phosphate-selective porin OprO and OprP